MTTPKHTKGPWKVWKSKPITGYSPSTGEKLPEPEEFRILDNDGSGIARVWERPNPECFCPGNENAARIVACVNACEGLSTTLLETTPQGHIEKCMRGWLACADHEINPDAVPAMLLALRYILNATSLDAARANASIAIAKAEAK